MAKTSEKFIMFELSNELSNFVTTKELDSFLSIYDKFKKFFNEVFCDASVSFKIYDFIFQLSKVVESMFFYKKMNFILEDKK